MIPKINWNKRIGMINIASTVMAEREWHIVLPDSVSFHVSRISLEGEQSTAEKILEMMNSGQVERAAKELASCDVDVIAFTCTAGSFIKGMGWDRKLLDSIESATGVPATTTSSGLLEALAEYDVKALNLATPYLDEINIKEEKFLEDNGFKVEAVMGEGCLFDNEIGRVEPQRFVEMHREMYRSAKNIEACFISCTNSRTIEAIPVLERELNIPVLSSNQVTLWSALRKCNFKDKVNGYGRLLREKM